MYKRILVSLFFLFVGFVVNAQDTVGHIGRLPSKLARIETRANTADKWKVQDFAVYHLVVFDMKARKIVTYKGSEKSNDLSFTTMRDEKTKTGIVYTFECVDEEGLQCKGVMIYDGDRPLLFRVEYSLARFSFFITE